MNATQLGQLREMLTRFIAESAFDDAKHHAKNILTFVSDEARPWSRATLHGHLTASAWVLDRTRTHVAMIHHRKLNRWLQPGGHIEDADSSWRAAAQREVTEETGLARFVAQEGDAELFDADVHPIPVRGDVPAHFHYDLRFLFVADVDATVDSKLMLNAEEAHDCRWFVIVALKNDPGLDPSLRRMIELSIRRFAD